MPGEVERILGGPGYLPPDIEQHRAGSLFEGGSQLIDIDEGSQRMIGHADGSNMDAGSRRDSTAQPAAFCTGVRKGVGK